MRLPLHRFRVHISRPRTLRKRLLITLITRLALGLTIAAFGTFFAVHTVLQNRLDNELNGTAKLLNQYVAQQSPPRIPDFSTNTSEGTVWRQLSQAGLLQIYVQIRDVRDRPVFSAGSPVPDLPATLNVGPAGSGSQQDGAVLFGAGGSAGTHAAPAFRMRASRLPNGLGYVVLAVSEQDVNSTMGGVAKIEFGAWLVAFGMIGWLANRRIKRDLEPFERLGDQIVAIGAGELDQRVEPANAVTEVGRVGTSVNAMLARLERSFREQRASEDRLRRFIADASHELRTPLASIRGYAELFRRGAASRPEDLALAMRRIESESARMGVLVDELLLLARLDSGRPLGRRGVDLGALARDAARDSQAAGPQWPIEVTVTV